jgi:hypothetical protein
MTRRLTTGGRVSDEEHRARGLRAARVVVGASVAVAVLLLVWWAIGVTGGRSRSTGSTAASWQTAQMNQPATFGDWRYTVTDLRRGSALGRSGSPPKGQFYVVGIVLQDLGRSNLGLAANDFDLFDLDSGTQYKPATALIGGDGRAKQQGYSAGLIPPFADQAPPGVPLRYAIVYDVNPAARRLDLLLNKAHARVAAG